jgi:hypothetical protein
MAKKKPLQPRRKRMKQQGRLQAAKHWIPTYTGKSIVVGYRKWFGVDLPCSIRELKMLDVKLDEHYISAVLKSWEQQIIARQKKKAEQKSESEFLDSDSDENFYYIAGYTSDGCPYGIT